MVRNSKGRTPRVSGRHDQKSTHWDFEFKQSGNSVSVFLAGREVLSVSYLPQEFINSILDSWKPQVTEEQIRHARAKIQEWGGPPTRREAFKVLRGAYQKNVQNYANATASHIERNLVQLVIQVADMIFEEAKQNSPRLVSLQKNRLPEPISSPRLWDRILNRHKKAIRMRSGPTGQGRPEGSMSQPGKFSRRQLEARVVTKIRELDSPTRASVASALGFSNGKALYRLQKAYGETRPWKQIVRETLNN
jgi:hypothetical protein